ncbi:MAG TPA: type VI secretion system tube protein Hcp [Luteolibacter sp.]|nr:type VI secretion system tube protein Hcp [Luteolibacter sp.]
MHATRPSPLSKTLALVPPAVALVAQHASGAFDAYIKIGDIKGEVQEKEHLEWVRLDSIEWNVKREITFIPGGASRESGRPQLSEVTISKQVDKSSPQLFLNAVGGSGELDTVIIRLVESATRSVFYELTLSQVLVSSQKQGGKTDDDRPTESVSFNFLKIEMKYSRIDPKTGESVPEPVVGFDLAKSQPL